jgi:uncharacterized NAD-dependent epimerase/dehydratase family protein/phage shock protein A
MLNQLILDMKSQLGKAKQQVASAIADEKKLQADAEALRKQAEDWERRAMLAVQEGKDDLAKQALMRYNEALHGAQQLHETWLKHRSETEKLKLSLRQLNDKIEEAKRKKNILVARAKRAEAQQRIQETMSGMSDKSAFESFERMAEKIEAHERKAIAAARSARSSPATGWRSSSTALGRGSSDQQLLEPEAADGSAARGRPAGRQLGAGGAGGDVHDAEPDRGRGRGHHSLRPGDQANATAKAPVAAPAYLIIADGDFGPMTSKTANSVIRYRPDRVVAVLDRQHAGRTVADVLGFGGTIPVVGSIAEGLARGADAVLIGIAPQGGRLPAEWRQWLAEALDHGCDLWNGLHTFLTDDPVLSAKAQARGRRIHDLRRPPSGLPIASGLAKRVAPFVVLTVGTDCNVGKMTAQLQLIRRLGDRGLRTRFVATGQTGIMIEGWGIAVDAVVADFVAGAAEQLVLEGSRDADIVLVEGQGSINHPGYSGVTLGLLHGSCPDALILCHQSSREYLGDYREESWLRIPPLTQYIRWYESIGAAVHPTRVVAISLNTYDLGDLEARQACERAQEETGLPATDPVRFDSGPLVDAVLAAREAYLASARTL